MSIARCRTVVGSLYALMRNALGINVTTSLESQELSCTVAPDRRLVVLGHEPIAGFARDHGTVADEAAMLALHTLDSTTLLAEPRFVAAGDSCLRADDPGWRWHCISGHGQSLSDWERRPLAGAIASVVAGAQPLDADLTAIAAQGVSAWGLTRLADSGATAAKNALGIQRADIGDASTAGRALMAVSTPSEASVPVISSTGSVSTTPLSSLGGGGGLSTPKRRLQLANSGYLTWANSSDFWSGSGGAYTIVAKVLAAPTPASNWPTIARIGGFDGYGNAVIFRVRRDLSPVCVDFYCAVSGTVYNCRTTSAFAFDCQYHTIVGTSDGSASGLKIYVDGVAQAVTISDDGATTPGAPKLYVGGDANNNAGWLGFIDELAIAVGQTWSAEEVAAYQTSRAFPADPTWELELDNWPHAKVSGAVGSPTGFGLGLSIV